MISTISCGLKRSLRRSIEIRTKFAWNHDNLVNLSVKEVANHVIENKAWASSGDSKSVLIVSANPPKQQLDCGDMLEYIRRRAPGLPTLTSSQPGLRVLSYLLTFPLTTAYALSLLFPKHYERESINILIVGARSESSLPLIWWKEMLFTNHNILTHNIRMIGPGLLHNSTIVGDATTSITIRDRHKDHPEILNRRLNITNNFSSTNENKKQLHIDFNKLHQHPECNDLLRWADVFIMFNPGYGTDNLKESWGPTMQTLLHTRKPIICTAYGNYDLKRDLQALDQITSETDDQDLGEPIDFLIPPHENPFKSLKCTLDEKEEGDLGIIIANHSIYAVQAK